MNQTKLVSLHRLRKCANGNLFNVFESNILMKKLVFITIMAIALLQVSCSSKSENGGNLPVKINTTMEESHKWNRPDNLLTNRKEREEGVKMVHHSIDFDGKKFVLDKGTDSEIVYDVDDYTYNETDIYNGQGKQEQYIITATCKADGYPTHNISIIRAEGNYQSMVFVTIPLVDKRNELSGVVVMYGL